MYAGIIDILSLYVVTFDKSLYNVTMIVTTIMYFWQIYNGIYPRQRTEALCSKWAPSW